MAGGNHGGGCLIGLIFVGCLIGLIFVAAVVVMFILNGISAF